MGVFYFESKQLKKSMACFMKTLYIRQTEIGVDSLGAADCHYNLAVLYKLLDRPDRAEMHFSKAVKIRKDLMGPFSEPVC